MGSQDLEIQTLNSEKYRLVAERLEQEVIEKREELDHLKEKLSRL